MNILVLANKFPYPPKDGGSIATFNLINGLQQNGNEVTVLAINTSKHYFNIDDIPIEIASRIKFYDFFINTDVSILGLLRNLFFSNLPYNAARFIHKEFQKSLVQLLSKNKFDVIQIEGLYMLPYIDAIKKSSDAKIVYRSHNIEFEIWERILANENNWIEKIYTKLLVSRLKKFEKRLINTYDFVLPITNRDLNILNELGNSKPACVIPTGINIDEYKRSESSNYPNLFFIGALDWIPNQEGLLWFLDNCWSEILKTNNQLQLKVAGRNAPSSFISKLKRQNVMYLGEVDDAKKFMNENAIMIAPLLSGSGMRIKIIEGMALAKAIVTTNIGAEGIEVKNNENTVIANTKEEFIEAILKVTNDKAYFEEISMNARVFISKHYDNFAIAQMLSNFYKKELELQK